ncbi:MAG: hypothetical protein ACRDLP_13420 [Solirubrobacteraceae bacterium]
MRRLVPVAAALAAIVVLPSVATAATVAPSASARAAIVHVFGDPKAASPCLIVRLAASNHHYADVRFRHTSRCARWGFDGTNVIGPGGGARWKVLFEGSSYRCPVAHIPSGVQRDLGVCPR